MFIAPKEKFWQDQSFSRRDQKSGEDEQKHSRQSEVLVKCFLHQLIPTTEANRDFKWTSEGFQLLSLLSRRQVSSPSFYLREMLTVFCSHAKLCIFKKQRSYSEVLQKQLITPKLNLNLKAVYISTLCFTHESFHLLLKIADGTFLFTSTQEQNSLRYQGNEEYMYMREWNSFWGQISQVLCI